MYQKTVLIGNLGADPELKYTASQTALCSMRVATTETYNGEKKTEWHRITVWGKQAENCAQYLQKGSQVLIEGKIETRKWQDQDGKDRYSTEIKADKVQFMDGKKDRAEGGHRGSASQSPAGSGPEEWDDDQIPF